MAGVSNSGAGVHGQSTSSRGVDSQSTSGPGVEGSGAIGVKAESQAGYAIETTAGRVKLGGGIAGVATIASGTTSVTVKPGFTLSNTAFVLLTPQANIGDRGLWFTKGGSSMNEIHLSSSRSNDTKVSYLILEHA